MGTVVNFNAKKEHRPQRKKMTKHKCFSCNVEYVVDVMCTYKKPNYGYYQTDSEYYCLRCYNKLFY